MTRPLAWIVGSGGLLGASLAHAMEKHAAGIDLWIPPAPSIRWTDATAAFGRLSEHCDHFARAVLQEARPWLLVWCAGVGVVGTAAEELEAETRYFEHLLRSLGLRLAGRPGSVALASSAGGVYAGSRGLPLSEGSPCNPISDYGRNKLRQEAILAGWADMNGQISTLVARISNLYGVGQNIHKPQGLISHISRNLIHRMPVHVYVPLDTIRDYLFAPDCAAHLAVCLERLANEPIQRVTKLFAAEEVVTVAGLLGEFTRIAKGHPGIICSPTRSNLLQPSRLQFRSKVWRDVSPPQRTPLNVGIQRVHQHHLALFQQGVLVPTSLGRV